MRIVICRRSRCLGVMVWSVVVIHSTRHDLSQNTTSLSFVAFERSIGAGPDPSGRRSKLPVWTRTSNGTYQEATENTKGFEGMRTLLHQRDCHQEIFLVIPRQGELPEVDTAREGQQSTGERFHSSLHTKAQGIQ
jgi:hypothetical protein